MERPWQALPEGRKLAILREAVDWSGISNGDLATILLSEIDFARVTGAERKRVTDLMEARGVFAEMHREAAARGGGMPQRGEDRGIER